MCDIGHRNDASRSPHVTTPVTLLPRIPTRPLNPRLSRRPPPLPPHVAPPHASPEPLAFPHFLLLSLVLLSFMKQWSPRAAKQRLKSLLSLFPSFCLLNTISLLKKPDCRCRRLLPTLNVTSRQTDRYVRLRHPPQPSHPHPGPWGLSTTTSPPPPPGCGWVVGGGGVRGWGLDEGNKVSGGEELSARRKKLMCSVLTL